MNCKMLGLAGIAAAIAAPALAHHSFAMFDATRIVTLDGTVKEFKWTNPHAFIILTANDAKGEPAQWAVEMNGPAGIAREGWKPKTLTPGMKVQVTIHPLLDGNNGGQYLAVKLPDGTQMGHPEGRVIGPNVRGSDVP
jgi:Family of unknown function (DUF6152)